MSSSLARHRYLASGLAGSGKEEHSTPHVCVDLPRLSKGEPIAQGRTICPAFIQQFNMSTTVASVYSPEDSQLCDTAPWRPLEHDQDPLSR